MNSVTNKTRLAEKQNEINKRRKLIRKQNESNKETKQNERRQKRENMVEYIDLGRFFELATSNKIYVNIQTCMKLKMTIYKVTQAILS